MLFVCDEVTEEIRISSDEASPYRKFIFKLKLDKYWFVETWAGLQCVELVVTLLN